MKTRCYILLFLSSCLLASCVSDIAKVENEDIVKVQPTLSESKLKEAALIITDLVKNPDVVRELKFAVDYSRNKLGRDEDVYFSELFSQNASYKNKTTQSLSGNFATAFRNAMKKQAKEKNSTSSVEGDLEAYLKENNMKLYWPYSENWDNNVTPTLSYDPLDNEDENEGFKPVNDTKSKNNNSISSAEYEIITMNDEYAYNNPSLLIVPCRDNGDGTETCGGTIGGGFPGDGDPIDNDDGGSGKIAKKILIGEAKLTKQMDGLFAGGSEIYWHSANAVLVTPDDTKPSLKAIKIKYSFSRSDIRNKRWKGIHSLFDQNWSDYELARQLRIIEGDGDPKIKSFSIKVGIPKVADVGFDIENFEVDDKMDSRKTTLYDNYLERDIFLADNDSDDGNGLKNGVKIWHADHLYWTMPEFDINY